MPCLFFKIDFFIQRINLEERIISMGIRFVVSTLPKSITADQTFLLCS